MTHLWRKTTSRDNQQMTFRQNVSAYFNLQSLSMAWRVTPKYECCNPESNHMSETMLRFNYTFNFAFISDTDWKSKPFNGCAALQNHCLILSKKPYYWVKKTQTKSMRIGRTWANFFWTPKILSHFSLRGINSSNIKNQYLKNI